MHLNDESTWPSEVIRFLDDHQALFDDWYGPTSEAREGTRKPGDYSDGPRFPWQQHDHAIGQLEALLMPHTLEAGHHCTRLTDAEIDVIRSSGMQLQNAASLSTRIRVLEHAGVISAAAAAAFVDANSADDFNRAGKIWFCFFPPHIAGESGIEGFFRYWGGESLYRLHDEHPERGSLLQRIGSPCIVVADVPIALLKKNSGLSIRLIRRYFLNRGGKIKEDIDHQGYAVTAVPASSIRRIVRFPEQEFIELTRCDTWRTALASARRE